MVINASEISDEGLRVDFVEKLKALDADASASLTLSRSDWGISISGTVESRISLDCGRCLKGIEVDISAPVELSFAVRQDGSGDDGEPADADDETEVIGEEIDLGHIVEEQVLLNVPMRPLCSEKCKGLCPKCGADLNVSECGCSKETVDPRLQILERLRDKGEHKNG